MQSAVCSLPRCVRPVFVAQSSLKFAWISRVHNAWACMPLDCTAAGAIARLVHVDPNSSLLRYCSPRRKTCPEMLQSGFKRAPSFFFFRNRGAISLLAFFSLSHFAQLERSETMAAHCSILSSQPPHNLGFATLIRYRRGIVSLNRINCRIS